MLWGAGSASGRRIEDHAGGPGSVISVSYLWIASGAEATRGRAPRIQPPGDVRYFRVKKV
jgi:hypothetical protein